MVATKAKLITVSSADVTGGPHTNFPVPVRLGDDADIAAAAHRDGRDIRFVDNDGTTALDYELIPNGHCLTPDGIWTWFTYPRAIYAQSTTYNRTYFGVVNSGGTSASSYVKVGYYDHDDDSTQVYPLSNLQEKDDHNNPALYFRPSDEKILACYSKHNDTHRRRRVSTSAEDVSSWGSETTSQPDGTGEYTYSNLLRLSTEGTSGRLYDFYRYVDLSNNVTWRYITSDDDGDTWSSSSTLFSSNANSAYHPYPAFASNGSNRIDFFFTDSHPVESNQRLCHFYYDGAFKQSDGTAMGTAPYDYTDATLVHDASAGTDRVWVWHAALDGTTPVVLYTVFPANDTTDHRLYYGRWNGSSWDTEEITDLGTYLYSREPYYSGGAAFDIDSPDTLVLSKVVSGVHEIQEWTRSGGTWSKTDDITSGSSTSNARPIIPHGGGNNTKSRILWWGNGQYTSYTDYHEAIRCHPAYDSEYAYAVVNVPTLNSGSDTTFYITYDDSSATDGQDPSNVYDANYLAVANGHIPIKGELSNIASKGTVNCENRIIGEFWDSSPMGGGIWINTQYGSSSERYDITANFAGLSEFTTEAWFETDGTGSAEHNIFSGWDVSEAGILFRFEPSGNTLEGFAILQTNTAASSNPFSTLTVSDNTPTYVAFAFEQTGTADFYARTNQAESSNSVANANNMDAGTSPTLRAGNGGGDQSLATDPLKGAIGRVLISDVLRSKDWTDTQYDLADGTAVTLGSEITWPIAGGSAMPIIVQLLGA